jgi:hypothetical protein
VLGRENFTTLLNAFPTVSNFAIDLFSTIGFTSIYLIGVDLGFVDVKHHHSKSSGYYQEDGKETYDFTKSANTSLIVLGNFRPTVNTKHEFKVSRQVIEQVTSAKPKGQEFYNCSDGARVKGTLPIRPDELLIVVTEQQKTQIVEKLKTQIFSTKDLSNYSERFEKQFSQDLLIKELNAFQTLLEKDVTCKEDIELVINKQKEMLFTSYKNGNSLLFYYLYGTVNYANAMLTKLVFTKHATEAINKTCNEMREKWNLTVNNIITIFMAQKIERFDVTSFHKIRRESEFFRLNYKGESVIIVSDSDEYTKACKIMLQSLYPWVKSTLFLTYEESKVYSKPIDYCIFVNSNNEKRLSIEGKASTIIISNSYDPSLRQYDTVTQMITPKMDRKQTVCSPLHISFVALVASFNTHNCQVIVPKYQTCNISIFEDQKLYLSEKNDQIYDFSLYMTIYAKSNLVSSSAISGGGSRGKPFFGKLTMKNLIYKTMPVEELESVNKEHLQKLQ